MKPTHLNSSNHSLNTLKAQGSTNTHSQPLDQSQINHVHSYKNSSLQSMSIPGTDLFEQQKTINQSLCLQLTLISLQKIKQ